MDWIQVSIYTVSEGIEAVCDLISQAGAPSVEIVDDIESIREHLKEQAQFWDYVDENELLRGNNGPCVRVYLNDNDSGHETLENIERAIDELKENGESKHLGSLNITKKIVNEEDWANNWKQYYKPLPIGQKLLIKPAWEDVPQIYSDRVILELEPGMVFGTGEHQSTQLCLQHIEEKVVPGMKMLDLGCGSGILSIAAMLLGAKSALAVDVEEIAKDIALENAQRNGIVADNYTVLIGDAIKSKSLKSQILSEKYDIIAANIVADVIIALLPLVMRCIEPGGFFVCSGIIDDRRDDVEHALVSSDLKIECELLRDGWVSFCCRAIG